jgi:c-di-GMP-binding flagellar brake protein YcgR
MPERIIPVQTMLTLSVQQNGKTVDYICTLLGYGRYGLQLSLPQILTQTYSLPVMTPLVVYFIAPSGNQLLSFKSYVMGYERTEPPCMVIAFPNSIETAERRATLRYPVEVPVAYMAEAEEVFGEHTRTIDISLGGLRMVTSRVLAPGTPLSLTLQLPEDTLLLSGMVVWSSFRGRRAMAGVQFTRMKESAQAALAKFLADKERQIKGLDRRA